jgi:hypothetical protein
MVVRAIGEFALILHVQVERIARKAEKDASTRSAARNSMHVRDSLLSEIPRDYDALGDYRATVDRLREETAAELGHEPMPPEKLSMIATALAALPLTALMLPPVPVELATWQVALVLALTWTASFRLQCGRYDRFQARWNRKVLAHAGAATPPAAESRFLQAR